MASINYLNKKCEIYRAKIDFYTAKLQAMSEKLKLARIGIKTCKKCNETKTVNDFYKRDYVYRGELKVYTDSICKTCSWKGIKKSVNKKI